ncbi:exopolysaccharide biosynthesis polyprenyl glycosylphosphotransferase [Rapidithrix thailandica]|uniref:Exopolysaccharide biosynthesis polyprenyl glycosylphosphotransferase n=1 Tax=Rapidithrix thailandica TaxID=413964 RepID=A0AAW9SBN1_9BACT
MFKRIRSYTIFSAILMLIDVCIIDFSFRLGYYLRLGPDTNYSDIFISLFVISNLAWLVALLFLKNYRVESVASFPKVMGRLALTFLIHAAIITAFILSLKINYFPLKFLLHAYGFSALLILLFRYGFTIAVEHYKKLSINVKKVVVVGTGSSANELHHFFNSHRSVGYQFLGFFDDQPNYQMLSHKLYKGSLRELKKFCLTYNVDEIYYAKTLEDKELIADLSRFSDDNFIYFRLAPDFSNLSDKQINIYFHDSIPIMTMRDEPLGRTFNQIVKRGFDVCFSLFVILFIFPFLFPLIALMIYLESKGPILFKQLRMGKKNRMFECFKFRTMYVGASSEQQTNRHDQRVTRVGMLLRKTSLDELPQFFNVLLGDMSVVGPRPHCPYMMELEDYTKLMRQKYKFRHFITPGITGYAQVNGCRGAIKEQALLEKRVDYDVMYMENWSLLLDMKIIFQTVKNLVRGEENAF